MGSRGGRVGFNPCPRVGGNSAASECACPPLCFNPCPRVGGNRPPLEARKVGEVSIHAPAWGATRRPHSRESRERGFNPCPRVGGNAIKVFGDPRFPVSIHAPAWGATSVGLISPRHNKFQSMPPRGGQPKQPRPKQPRPSFNPCPRVGGNRVRRSPSRLPQCFNPCPRVGGNLHVLAIGPGARVSIHAPAWGATLFDECMFALALFQSMPPRGGQRGGKVRTWAEIGFNPCPRVGGNQSFLVRAP